ncbi:MAG: hypothetical protein ACK49R_05175 [Planctomycetota bacterium]
MGLLKFKIPDCWPLERRQASSLHVVGLDGIAWPCRIGREDQLLTVNRNKDESGHLFMAYPFPEDGELVVSTGTLPEGTTPYDLTRELARGTLNRLRNQLSNWQEGGLQLDEAILAAVQEATNALEQCIFATDSLLAEKAAAASLAASMRATFGLSQAFAEQITPIRRAQVNVPKFWFGARLRQWDQAVAARLGGHFEIIQLDHCTDLDPSIQNAILGPLLDASPNGLSPALLEADDFDARRNLLMAEVREQAGNLPPAVKMIHAVAGLNGTGHRQLSYPQQLQAAIDVLQTLEDSGNRCPTMISFDGPWCEKLAWSVGGVHALQIADSLLRRGVTVNMLGLEIHLDYSPTGSLAREPLQWVELVDTWSQFGLPLVILLRAPLGYEPPTAVGRPASGDLVINQPRGGLQDHQRLRLLETVLPMLLARPAVQGIVWQQARDGDDPRYPGSGLLDDQLVPKPALHLFDQLREKFF